MPLPIPPRLRLYAFLRLLSLPSRIPSSTSMKSLPIVNLLYSFFYFHFLWSIFSIPNFYACFYHTVLHSILGVPILTSVYLTSLDITFYHPWRWDGAISTRERLLKQCSRKGDSYSIMQLKRWIKLGLLAGAALLAVVVVLAAVGLWYLKSKHLPVIPLDLEEGQALLQGARCGRLSFTQIELGGPITNALLRRVCSDCDEFPATWRELHPEQSLRFRHRTHHHSG